MFQTGYLTIAETMRLGNATGCRLKYPKQEVYQSLNESLLADWTADVPFCANRLSSNSMTCWRHTTSQGWAGSYRATRAASTWSFAFREPALIFEFKFVDDGTTPSGNSALAAIEERGNAKRYHAEGISVDSVGIEFSRKQRRIVAWDTKQGEFPACPLAHGLSDHGFHRFHGWGKSSAKLQRAAAARAKTPGVAMPC